MKKPVKQRYTVFVFDNAESHFWVFDSTMYGTSAMDVRRRFFRKYPDMESSTQYVRVRKYKLLGRAKKIPLGRDFMH